MAGLYFDPMTILVGLFFILISLMGLLMGQSKKFIRKVVIIVASLGLTLAQVLFMNNKIAMEGQDFVAISGMVGAVILILGLQRNTAW